MASTAIPRAEPSSSAPSSDRRLEGALALIAVTSIVVAAFVPSIRVAVLAALVAGLLASWRFRFLLWPVAAVLPAALNLAWGTLPQPVALPGDVTWCSDLLSPPAWWRAGESIGVFMLVALLLRRLHVRAAEIGLVRPNRNLLAASVVAGVVV